MRLGGPIFESYDDAKIWAHLVKKANYTAALCPVDADAGDAVIASYANEAKKNNIVIAEVGVWNNPITTDNEKRKQAIEFCKKQLALSEQIGALCCVNIAGSRGEKWDGPHPDNFKKDTFALIVDTVREIIDSVKPRQTYYTLEPMPWIFPDTPESYLNLIKAIDREAFAVHLDPVNMIISPQIYLNNGDFLRECFRLLGPYIKSCHAKDIIMDEVFVTHISEVAPGQGVLDYKTYISEINKLNPDIPLIVEHLTTKEEYESAADYILSIAASLT